MGNKREVSNLAILNIVGSVFSVLYSIMQVQYFGATREVEIFFAASTLVYMVISLTQSGQLSEIFLPIYINKKKMLGERAAFKASSVVLNWLILFTLLIGGIAWLGAEFLVELIVPGFSQADVDLAVNMFRVLAFYFVLEIVIALFITILNAEKVYGKTEATKILNRTAAILILIFFYKEIGVWVLVVSLWLSKIFQFSVLVYYLRKEIGFKYYMILYSEDFKHKSFLKTAYNTFSYVLATQGYNMVLTASVSFLPEGTYAVFKYVQNLYAHVRSIILNPINTVFFTEISNTVQLVKEKITGELMNKYAYYSLLIVVFAFICVCILGKEVLAVLWGNDKFGVEYLTKAHNLMMFNFIAFAFVSIGKLYRSLGLSLGYAKKIYSVWTITQLISAALAWLLIKNIDFRGLILTVFLNSLFLSIVPLVVVLRYSIKLSINISLNNILKLIALLMLTSGAGWIVKSWIITGNLLSERGILIIESLLVFTVMVSTFGLLSYVFRTTESIDMSRFILKKLRVR